VAHRRRAALAEGDRGAGDWASCASSPAALARMPRLLLESHPKYRTRCVRASGMCWVISAMKSRASKTWKLRLNDKAPIMALLATLDAFREAHITPTSNFVLLFEGEEEAGSPHLGAYFDAHVTIDGFYDDVVPPSDADLAALATVPGVDDELKVPFGLGATEQPGRSLVEGLLLPALNVRGLAAGTVGPTARNVIPATATASLDIRLVKGNDPRRILDLLERHVRKQGYTIVREHPDRATRLAHPKIARIVRGGGYRAARRASGGEDVVLMPTMGGSLPLYLFEDKLDAPTIIVPIANHDKNQHAPDENLRIANLWYGMDLMAAILTLGDSAE